MKSYFVIVRLDRIIQNLLKTLDSPIKSWNDGIRKTYYIDRLYVEFQGLQRITGRIDGRGERI